MSTSPHRFLGWLKNGITRRQFIEASSMLAAGAAVLGRVPLARADGPSVPDPVTGAEIHRTACMMCNAGCGIQVKVKDGVALHIEGNAFDPQCSEYDAGAADVTPGSLPKADLVGGSLCPRGAAGLMALYDPMRLKTPLKRSGPRGSGQWEAISWEQAIQDICWGGRLPDGSFDGLAAIRDLTNKFSNSDTQWGLDAPVSNPANYGFKANQLLMCVGRDQIGEATGRFMSAYGSINRIDHTSTCNSAYKLAGYQNFVAESKATGTYNFKPDLDGADYVVFFGSNPVEANAPTNTFIRKLGAFRKRGGKLVIVDPTFTNSAAKADWWIGSIKGGTDSALALAICRHLIDNNLHRAEALRRSHAAAPATALTSPSWTDSTYLVNEATHKYVTCQDAGLNGFAGTLTTAVAKTVTASATATLTLQLNPTDLGGAALNLAAWPPKGNVRIGGELLYYSAVDNTAKTLTVTARGCKWTKAADATVGAAVTVPFVVARGGTLLPYHDNAGGLLPDLEHRGTLGADSVKSVFALFRDSLDTVANYSALCGVSVADIQKLGDELGDPAKKVCVDMYRGALAHTNGTYAVRAIHAINTLLDRVDRKGGYVLGKRYKAGSVGTGQAFPASTGVKFDRSKAKFEPLDPTQKPRRPWFPLGYFGVQQEIWPSVKIGYPYPLKALITFTSNPAYSTPYNRTVIEALVDRQAVPLHVCVDVLMSETAALADYVLPDTTYLEKWANGITTGYATVHTTGSVLRRPVVGTIDPTTKAYTPALPGTMGMDDILILMGKELGLPGYGTNGIGTGKNLDQAWQYYDEMYKTGDLGMATGLSDLNAPILKMGGKFKNPAALYDASTNFINDDAKYKNVISLYCESLATSKHSYTKKYFSGLPIWEVPHTDWKGTPVVDATSTFNLRVLNFKSVQQVQSRSTGNKWLREIRKENEVWMHPSDAAARGIADGDMVRVRSATYGSRGRAWVTESAQPGTIVIPYSFGRWELGARPWLVDGTMQPTDAGVARGIAVNPLQSPDPQLMDVCFTDPLSGSCEFYSTYVAAEKV